jgi:hypothetical protein
MAAFALSISGEVVIFIRAGIFISILFLSVGGRAECFKDLSPLFQQAKNYFSRGQYLLATQQFSTFSLLSCSQQDQDNGRLRWAQSLFELGENQEANLTLSLIHTHSPAETKSRVLRAWYQPMLVSTLPDSEKKRFDNFRDEIKALPELKKPWLAGTLSAVLPGAGQIYNGNLESGLFSFVLNALFLGATLELHNKNMNSTALASGVVFSVLYVGNIVGSVQASHSLNTISQEPARKELQLRDYPELTF